jgi:hypothetical protein
MIALCAYFLLPLQHDEHHRYHNLLSTTPQGRRGFNSFNPHNDNNVVAHHRHTKFLDLNYLLLTFDSRYIIIQYLG